MTDLVSVVIVNLDGKAHLEKCLKSLFEVTYSDFEVIVIDNHSTDQSISFLKENYPQVKIKSLEKNYGFAHPNNLGAKIANGKYILFLNNDTVVTPNFMTELVSSFQNNSELAICQSMLLKPDDTVDSSGDYVDSLGIAFNSKEKIVQPREILSARGASMMIRKDIFEELGGFDEKFFVSFEDVDLGWRAWIKGYTVMIAPKSVVCHLGGQTTKTVGDIAFHGFKNQLSMIITNFESITNMKKLFSFVFYGCETSLTKNSRAKPSTGVIIRGILWNAKNLGYLLSKHKQVNQSRVNGTKQLQKLDVIKKDIIR